MVYGNCLRLHVLQFFLMFYLYAEYWNYLDLLHIEFNLYRFCNSFCCCELHIIVDIIAEARQRYTR